MIDMNEQEIELVSGADGNYIPPLPPPPNPDPLLQPPLYQAWNIN